MGGTLPARRRLDGPASDRAMPPALPSLLLLTLAFTGGAVAQGGAECDAVGAPGGAAPVEVVEALGATPPSGLLCPMPDGRLAGQVLGDAHAALGDTARAIGAWDATLLGLDTAPPSGQRDDLVGRLVETLARSGRGGAGRAVAAYDRLLAPTEGGAGPRSPYWAALARMASVLPDDVRAAAFVGGDWRRGVGAAGSAVLRSWWLSQDPFPATPVNERVAEHLIRVGIALGAYPAPAAPLGYDDRGDLFVRYGAPDSMRRIRFNNAALVVALARVPVGVQRSSFPKNEVWIYKELGQDLWYILVEENGVYRSSRSSDLLPLALRNATGPGRRQQEIRTVALLAMETIYDQLATLSMEYGTAWSEVSAAVNQTASPYANPGSAINRIQRQLGVQEGEWEQRRVELEPPSRSRIEDETPPAPFVADAARFREADGTTRIALAWQLDHGRSVVDDQAYTLIGTVVVDPQTSGRRMAGGQIQALTAEQVRGDAFTPPATADVACDRAPCSVNVQFDLQAGGVPGGPLVGVSVWDVPVTGTLPRDGFVMSDLQPFDAVRNVPYVRPDVVPGTPLSVYFETYGFGREVEVSQVYVEYEVVRRRLGSLLRRTREVPTSGDVRLNVRGETTEQFVILETSDWAGADEVEVLVRVRDERTGATAERTRTFAVL